MRGRWNCRAVTSGRTNHLHGLAAEDAAARLYEGQGGRVLARRARTAAGEIDLVVALPGLVAFVEVKARRSLSSAAVSLSARQIARIGQAAEVWLAAQGYPSDTPMRFDVVLSDRHGGIEIVENALGFDT